MFEGICAQIEAVERSVAGKNPDGHPEGRKTATAQKMKFSIPLPQPLRLFKMNILSLPGKQNYDRY